MIWAFFVLTYIFILYYTMNIQYNGNCDVNKSCIASNVSAIVVLVAFGLYLLAGNTTTLNCAGANGVLAYIVIRVLVLILVITAIVLLLVYRCLSKTRQEKLLPRALYLYLHSDYDEHNDLPLETVNSSDDKKDNI